MAGYAAAYPYYAGGYGAPGQYPHQQYPGFAAPGAYAQGANAAQVSPIQPPAQPPVATPQPPADDGAQPPPPGDEASTPQDQQRPASSGTPASQAASTSGFNWYGYGSEEAWRAAYTAYYGQAPTQYPPGHPGLASGAQPAQACAPLCHDSSPGAAPAAGYGQHGAAAAGQYPQGAYQGYGGYPQQGYPPFQQHPQQYHQYQQQQYLQQQQQQWQAKQQQGGPVGPGPGAGIPPQMQQQQMQQQQQRPQVNYNAAIPMRRPMGAPAMLQATAAPAFVRAATPSSATTPTAASPAGPRPPAPAAAPAAAQDSATWPPAMRAYVQRAFSAVDAPAKATWLPGVLKGIIAEAWNKGEVFTRNWDKFPLPKAPPGVGAAAAGAAAAAEARVQQQAAIAAQQLQHQQRWQQQQQQQQQQQGGGGGGGGGGGSRGRSYSDSDSRSRSRSRSHSRSYSRSRSRSPPSRPDSRATNGSEPSWFDKQASSRKALKLAKQQQKFAKQQQNKWSRDVGALSAEQSRRLASREGRFGDGRAPFGGGGFGDSLQERRAKLATLQLAAAETGAGADADWDQLTIKGTCASLEKSYFRLTSAPDPSSVRPEPVLRAALHRLKSLSPKPKWLYVNDQLKAMRQDLTVQRIRDAFAAEVYEHHGREALDYGDLAEYNQCQTALKALYREGADGEHAEFIAYRVLYYAVAGTESAHVADLLEALTPKWRAEASVRHALEARAAIKMGDAAGFFRLLGCAPNRGRALMEAAVEKMRFHALTMSTRAYAPGVPVLFLGRMLGFAEEAAAASGKPSAEEVADEAVCAAAAAWLRAHGAVLTGKGAEGLSVDCKASKNRLFVPAAENAVSHGDVDLDVTDFMKNFSS